MSVRTGVNEYNQPTSDISSGYVGEFKYFGFESVPPHCLACDGSEVSRETYSELFAVFGTMYGAGDGTNTFNLPDLRGYFLRGANGTNSAAMGTAQGDAIRNITGSVQFRPYKGILSDDSTDSTLFGAPQGAFNKELGPVASGSGEGPQGSGDTTKHGNEILLFDASRVVPTAAEVRPINYAVNICVVYE